MDEQRGPCRCQGFTRCDINPFCPVHATREHVMSVGWTEDDIKEAVERLRSARKRALARIKALTQA